ncbi:MAG TPA: tyrosine--tRNA ligase, partial [Sulfurospirillum sp. UBA11407]
NKMSKSLGNYVGVTDEPSDMFGKMLSISDELMWRYYELLSAKSLEEIATLKEKVSKGELHPKVAKEDLAQEIVARYYDQSIAKSAREEFN